MNTLLEIWNGYLDYFVDEWPLSLMWTVTVPIGLSFTWTFFKENFKESKN